MIQNLRNIKLRIRNIENTQKITRVMEIVSSVKLNRAKSALHASRSYFEKIELMLARLLSNTVRPRHPLLEKKASSGSIALCVITSDAGLCSVYNYAILKHTEDFIKGVGADKVRLIAVGKEGYHYFKKLGYTILKEYLNLHGRYSQELSQGLTDYLTGLFLSGSSDEVYIAYTHFGGMIRHRPMVQKFLNIDNEFVAKTEYDYIAEPDVDKVASVLIPRYLAERTRLSLLESFTAEHAARMIAMKTATDNAEELIDTLTLLRNKARQAAITKEVLEIASGAEAVKG